MTLFVYSSIGLDKVRLLSFEMKISSVYPTKKQKHTLILNISPHMHHTIPKLLCLTQDLVKKTFQHPTVILSFKLWLQLSHCWIKKSSVRQLFFGVIHQLYPSDHSSSRHGAVDRHVKYLHIHLSSQSHPCKSA